MVAGHDLDTVRAILVGKIITLLGDIMDTHGHQRVRTVFGKDPARQKLLGGPTLNQQQQQ